MRPQSTIFFKVLATMLLISVIPVIISSLLIASNYETMVKNGLNQAFHDDHDRYQVEIEKFSILRNENKNLVFFTVAISLIVTLFFAIYLSKTFTLPLIRFSQAAEMVGRGNLGVRLEAKNNDEFGRLAMGFNKMAKDLATAQNDLREANTILEGRVHERTAELTMMNNELKKTAEKIYESNRTKGEFLANVSHELRTPLNAILGYVDLITDGIYGDVGEKQQEPLEKIRNNSTMLLRLINEILDLAHIESGRMPVFVEEFSPLRLVEDTASKVRALFEKKGLKLIISPDQNLPRMHSDPQKIQQVLLNLLSNALKFTDEGHVEVVIHSTQDQSAVYFSVTDTGIGIASENQEVIFDQFRQIDGSSSRAYAGTGLGLSLSRKIVSLLDGELTLKSLPGQGSTFTVTLPTIHWSSEVPEIEEEDFFDQLGEGDRVIVSIDDDEDVLKLISDSLTPSGYKVACCTDGDKGVRKIKELLPFAITLDIMMTYRDGWSVLRELKSNPRTKNIPVIIISIIEDRIKGEELGVDEYLIKPINRRKLLNALALITGRAGSETEPFDHD